MSGDAPVRRLRVAEIIAVGSELLVPPRLDTNSLFITERLGTLGIDVRIKTIVGDRREELEEVLRGALHRSDLVVLSGGLGPTDDDLTRDAVASVLGRPMTERADLVERIRARFAARGARMPEVNRKQAYVPEGAQVIANPRGTAPGLWIEHDSGLVILLPGPPSELKPMFDHVVDEWLAPLAGTARVYRRVIRTCGRTESEVEELTQPIYRAWLDEPDPIDTTILTAPAQVELHLAVRAEQATRAGARLDAAVSRVRQVLGDGIVSDDGRSIEQVVGDLLRERDLTIAVAESCTGGLISSKLTDVPGSSSYVTYNAVCYANDAKVRWLGVDAEVIAAHGAVSEPVARAMADGIRAQAGASVGVGVTGIAGPTGGSPEKPVGTVVVAVAYTGSTVVRTFRFPFDRVRVKQFAAHMALDLVRRVLTGVPPGQAFVVASAARGPNP